MRTGTPIFHQKETPFPVLSLPLPLPLLPSPICMALPSQIQGVTKQPSKARINITPISSLLMLRIHPNHAAPRKEPVLGGGNMQRRSVASCSHMAAALGSAMSVQRLGHMDAGRTTGCVAAKLQRTESGPGGLRPGLWMQLSGRIRPQPPRRLPLPSAPEYLPSAPDMFHTRAKQRLGPTAMLGNGNYMKGQNASFLIAYPPEL